jgi:cytochrome oxidase Cu insertion factor (SCO1/SenC/PrrC family)
MGVALQADNSTIVSAFRSALLHQGLVVLLVVALVLMAWNAMRALALRRAVSSAEAARVAGGLSASLPMAGAGREEAPEPPARRVLRVGFGLLWILDGVLQGQIAMPLGLPTEVVQPAAAGSPAWVQHLVNAGVTIWSNHPVTAAASTVWIQLGIGAWLLVAPRGRWSRAAGLAAAGWGVLVWVFGEAFGGIFAPGLSVLFGAPGAVLFYVVAGVAVAAPERAFSSARLGRQALAACGAFFLGMAVLQAWPGRGFWRGAAAAGRPAGTLYAMVKSMESTPQPHALVSMLGSFASFDAAHGFAVNLVVVAALAVVGVGLVAGHRALVRASLAVAVVLCLADWVLVEDLGMLGGVGTDPNSMVPLLLVLGGAYLAWVRVPRTAGATSPVVVPLRGASLRERLLERPTYAFRAVAAIGAVTVALLGAAPMAAASIEPTAAPILAEATDGTPNATDFPAPGFRLLDQYDQPVSLASLRGKVVVVTFLDPVCTSDCPVIAQELREADQMLGADSRKVDIVAVVANPLYRGVAFTRAFDRTEGLTHLANWLYLTGSLASLEGTWNHYGVQVAVEPGGSMVAHSDLAYVIDASGMTRYALDANPGAGTSSTKSSFAGLLASLVRPLVPRS